MGIWAKIGWLFLWLLVAFGIAILFWLDLILGAVFTVFCSMVCFVVFGLLKKKTDKSITESAQKIGLKINKHPFRYYSLVGTYKGKTVQITYESTTGYGLGSMLVTQGAQPAWAILDIKNITLITMEHGPKSQKKRLLTNEPFPILVKKNKIMTIVVGILTDAAIIQQHLDRLEQASVFLTNR